MRVVDIRERPVPISRYSDPTIESGGLTTSIVAITTDAVRNGRPVVGYGFSSIGRFAQSGLIRERFAPRLLAAGDVDPFGAWRAMMQGEKPGGHGDRSVAVGTLDMALWDAAAKIADVPLYRYLAETLDMEAVSRVRVYAGGGYRYPHNDIARLTEEIRAFLHAGYTHVKIKIGGAPVDDDRKRIEAALELLPADRLAVDAMNAYDGAQSVDVARALAQYGLWWFEDVCDPLDFQTQSAVAQVYPHPMAAGEALFSVAEAKLLDGYGGLRRDRDILLFDPAHCYGLVGYLQIVEALGQRGWRRSSFWPHGGHLFTLHVAAALRLGGTEVNPRAFAPFGGLADGVTPADGYAEASDAPGIGFETKRELLQLFEQ
jgi:L-alanine-DL-glutamate epimerase-like enolase superfamily enzyme